MQQVMMDLLQEADRYYASAEHGIVALPFTAGLAVRAASRLYHAIGLEVAAQDFDPRQGRAVVPQKQKVALAMRAALEHGRGLGAFARERWLEGKHARSPTLELDFPQDVLPSNTHVTRTQERSRPLSAP